MTKIRIVFLLIGLGLCINLFAQDIYDINSIQEVRISFEESNWHELLDSLKQAGKDDRLLGEVEVNGEKYEKVGVRYKGNSSYKAVRKMGSSKLPFNIKVNYKKKKQLLPGGYKTLKLSNVFRDPSFLREVLSYEIAGRYMPAPRANFVKVYVNDEYLGLYNNTESIDNKFLKRSFGENDGPFFKCDPKWNPADRQNCKKGEKSSLVYVGDNAACYIDYYEIKSDTGWHDLINLTKILNKKPEAIESVLDVNMALWMLAFNSVLVNLDSYNGRLCHNYYLYKDTSGVFHPLVWDMNLSFGAFRYTGIKNTPLTDEGMQTLSLFEHYKQKNPKRPLIINLLSNGLYRKMYVAHVRTILEDYFYDGTYLKRAEEIQKMIDQHVEEDKNRLYPYETFKKNLYENAIADKKKIIGIKELMEGRITYLKDHPLLNTEKPEIAEAEHLGVEESLIITARMERVEHAWLMYRHGNTGRFSRIEMFDDGAHNDEVDSDGVYGATLPFIEGTEYFLVAEGPKAAVISPERAAKELYVVKAKKSR